MSSSLYSYTRPFLHEIILFFLEYPCLISHVSISGHCQWQFGTFKDCPQTRHMLTRCALAMTNPSLSCLTQAHGPKAPRLLLSVLDSEKSWQISGCARVTWCKNRGNTRLWYNKTQTMWLQFWTKPQTCAYTYEIHAIPCPQLHRRWDTSHINEQGPSHFDLPSHK